MVPFLSMQIGDILHRLMRFFVPKHVLKTANSPLKLQQIDVQKSENIVGVSQIKYWCCFNIGISTKETP